MTSEKRLAPHELMELHEILTFKTLCATKASAMIPMVQDQEIKTLLQSDITTSKQNIQQLEEFLRIGLQNSTMM